MALANVEGGHRAGARKGIDRRGTIQPHSVIGQAHRLSTCLASVVGGPALMGRLTYSAAPFQPHPVVQTLNGSGRAMTGVYRALSRRISTKTLAGGDRT